jgi:hypothetical protein
MPTYAVYGGWVISIIAGWFEVTADIRRKDGFGAPAAMIWAEAKKASRY